MTHTLPYQLWLDSHALADDCMGAAYETLSGGERAVLKKCIARQHVVWGEQPGRERRSRTFRQGFGVEEDEGPASYVLLVCQASFASPAAFLAALMPALLAGASSVFPCFVPGPEEDAEPDAPPPAPLLGALELAGVERAFTATEAEVLILAESLRALSARGRIVLLGSPAFGESLALHAHRTGVLCRSLTQTPFYYSGRLCSVREQVFAREADEPREEGEAMEPCPDDDNDLFLHLDASHEDVWFWPKLGPDWFRTRRMRLFSCSAGERLP